MFNPRFVRPTWLLVIPVALVLVLAMACGSDEAPTPTPIDVSGIVREALAAQPAGITAADMAQAIQSELAKQPGVSQAEVTSAITKALEAQKPGITKDEVADAIKTALAAVPTATPQPTPEIVGGQLTRTGGIIDMQAYSAPASGTFFAPLNYNNYHLNGITSQLVEYDPETAERLDIRGDLAKDWTVSPDGLTYNFNIRQGVKFHNGEPMTMDDIIFSYTGWLDPNSSDVPLVVETAGGRIGSRNRNVLTYMESFRAVDENTFEAKLKFPSQAFMITMAFEIFHVLSKKAYQDGTGFSYAKPETVIGTGPYKLTNYKKDISSEWEKNPDYFREGRPFVDGIRNFIITDHGRVIAAIKTGQVHMNAGWNSNLNMAENAALADEIGDKVNTYVGGPFGSVGVMMNTRVGAPWNDPNVRRAMNLVLHRQPIIQTVSRGRNLLGTVFPPGFPWSFTVEEALQFPGYREVGGAKDPQDIAEAQRLMKEAGLGPGYKTTITCRTVVEFCQVSVLVKAQLKEFLGWDVDIREMESVAGMTAFVSGDFEFGVMANGLAFHDPDSTAASYRKGGTADVARTGYHNPKAELLWNSIATETNLAKRKALVNQVQQHYLEDDAWPPLYYFANMMFVDKRIRGFHPPPSLAAYQSWEVLWCDPSCR